MKLIFCFFGAFLFSSTVFAFPHPQKTFPPQCADPTFACQDLEHAKACGVTKTCIHDIWATMRVPDDNDEVCDICKEMVKEARDQLLSNMTQEEIKEVFEGSCKLLPIKLVADACIKVVDEIIPELVEMLASRMDPTMVCTVSGMCFVSHPSYENHLYKLIKDALHFNENKECGECITLATDVKTFLKTTSEGEVKKLVENLCHEKISKYLCKIIVNKYFNSLYQYILATDAKTLCSNTGICPKVCDPKGEKPIDDELTCEFCDHVLKHVIDLMTANTTVEEFRTALLNFCKHVRSFSKECTSLVNDYYDMLFDFLRKLDTKEVCTVMGLCNNEKCTRTPLVQLVPPLESNKRIPMTKILPAQNVLNKDVFAPFVRLIPAELLNKKDMVETNNIFPQELPLEQLVSPLPILLKDTECAFCKAVSFYLEKDLNGDRSKEGVRNAINQVCDRWVKDFPTHCQNFVSKYGEKVEHGIAKGIEWENICTFNKACEIESKNSELNVKVIPKVKGSPFCDLCKVAMTEIENELSDPAMKNKLHKFIDQSCNILPHSLRDDCKSFLNANIDAFIDILQQELQPDNFCPAIGLCSASSRLHVPHRVKDLECNVCKDVVSSLRQKLSDPETKKIVLTLLEETCARLPGSVAQECRNFVDENIDFIITMLVEELDPDSVCSLFNFCPASIKEEKPKNIKNMECDLCKEVVQKVEDLIKDHKTEEEIRQALDKVCSYLPHSMSARCQKFVDKYTDLLITLLTEEMDPSMVCSLLNVCSTSIKKRKTKEC